MLYSILTFFSYSNCLHVKYTLVAKLGSGVGEGKNLPKGGRETITQEEVHTETTTTTN